MRERELPERVPAVFRVRPEARVPDRGARSEASLTAARVARAELAGTLRREPSAFSMPDALLFMPDALLFEVLFFTATPFMTDGPVECSNLDATASAASVSTPDPRDAWTAAMRRADFARAWEIADDVLRARARPSHHLPRHEQHIWDGTPLEGRRVLVRCYHGLGDTLQFIRFVPWLTASCPQVTVWAQDKLLPLLATMPRQGRLTALHDGTPDIDYDVDVELMELLHVFRVTPAALPAHVPYLRVSPAWPARGAVPRVGLVWQAGDWDGRRSIPRPLLEPLLAARDVSWVVLQPGACRSDWGRDDGLWPAAWDLMTYARTVRSLDLLITIDSMPAHLAGALGVPVWTLLPAAADWRWMEEREDTPWYPTMRLFRQSEPGRWGDVIARVAQQLGGAME